MATALPTIITSHIVVDFGTEGETPQVILEVDDRTEGSNGGKTSFVAGDEVGLLLFVPDGYEVDTVMSTSGTITKVAADTKIVEETVVFPNEDTVSVQYPISSGLSYSWIGNVPGTAPITAASPNKLKIPARPVDAKGKPSPLYRIGVAKVSYTSDCTQYRLKYVPVTVTQVMVFVVVKKKP